MHVKSGLLLTDVNNLTAIILSSASEIDKRPNLSQRSRVVATRTVSGHISSCFNDTGWNITTVPSILNFYIHDTKIVSGNLEARGY